MVQNNDLLMDDLDDNLKGLGDAFGSDWEDLPTEETETKEKPVTEAVSDEPDEDLPGQLAVDVYEKGDYLIVKARTAGVDKKDLSVSISDGILTISGVLVGGDDIEGTDFHMQECYWGEFNRSLALPVQVKEDNIQAVLKEGVLTITFEKAKRDIGVVVPVQ